MGMRSAAYSSLCGEEAFLFWKFPCPALSLRLPGPDARGLHVMRNCSCAQLATSQSGAAACGNGYAAARLQRRRRVGALAPRYEAGRRACRKGAGGFGPAGRRGRPAARCGGGLPRCDVGGAATTRGDGGWECAPRYEAGRRACRKEAGGVDPAG